MVADDQLGLVVDGLGGRGGRDGQARHDPLDWCRRVAPDQAHVVPGLSQPRGANCSSQPVTSATVVMMFFLGVDSGSNFRLLSNACRYKVKTELSANLEASTIRRVARIQSGEHHA